MDENSSSGIKRLSSRGPSRATLNKLLIILTIIALAGVGGAGYFFYQYQNITKAANKAKTGSQGAQKAEQEQTAKLIAEVGKLIDLPAGETPTIATVTDVNKLKDQPFFQKAKNGNKVLIYNNAKKVILYDPDAHKIVDVGPFSVGLSGNQKTNAKIVIRNGTGVANLAAKVEAVVKKALPEAEIASKDNASRTNYEKSILVVLNDSAKDTASALAKVVDVQIGDLPSGETKPIGADILIIIGKDKI